MNTPIKLLVRTEYTIKDQKTLDKLIDFQSIPDESKDRLRKDGACKLTSRSPEGDCVLIYQVLKGKEFIAYEVAKKALIGGPAAWENKDA